MHKLKNDSYRRARGGQAHLIEIFCASCDEHLALYQKDGLGSLHRMYLNRILEPSGLEKLQHEAYRSDKEIPNLACRCGNLIGIPMTHNDKRYAFRMIPGTWYKKRHK